MDKADAFAKILALEAVFECVDVKELLVCMEVSQQWRLAAIPQLRRRLSFVPIPCITDVGAQQASSMCGTNSDSYHVMRFIIALNHCQRVAAMAGMKLSLLVLYYSGDYEKFPKFFRTLRDDLEDDCVVLQFTLNPSFHKFCACHATEHSVILGSLLFTADIEAQITARATLGIPVTQNRPESVSTPSIHILEEDEEVEVEEDESEPEADAEEDAYFYPLCVIGGYTGDPTNVDTQSEIFAYLGVDPENFRVGVYWSNVVPGLVAFKGISFELPDNDIQITTGSVTEAATTRTLQVKGVPIYGRMSQRRMRGFLETVKAHIGCTRNTLCVHLAFEPSRSTHKPPEVEFAFKQVFPDVPIMHFFKPSIRPSPTKAVKRILLMVKLLN
ncbi:hypothetical protein HPB48_018256 [Haemaphysalis longicornis]|uniref:Uncharacterized protein n=1 Tax=Haemaphysalis longicornis TaxID=44386 RepID=A0A9J6FTK2_HAELO|nr:hypothetical protein HPB48_018256 [Haemaphysalis longicornis]